MVIKVPNPQQPLPASSEDQRLKYLQFVHVAAFHAVAYSEKLYTYAKENSGPLKPRVDTFEGTVKSAFGPVYDKYQGAPVECLKFLDRKVDESICKVQSRVPEAARTVMSTVYDKCEPVAKDIYSEYEPVAEQYTAFARRALNQLPGQVGPAARYCLDKYNRAVQKAAEKGVTFSIGVVVYRKD